MNYSLIISAASALIAASAFIVALLNYRISRKLPNENKLFEEKFKSYRNVIAAMNTAGAVYVQCANVFWDMKSSGKSLKKVKDKIDMELTKAYYLLEDTVQEQILLLPDEVLEHIDNYFDVFNKENFPENITKEKEIEEFENGLNELFDSVVNSMRDDLAIEKLDNGLKKRIGSVSRARPFNISDIA
ncbi:hypothetical protein [Mucilaginibacter rubeus]|uniref:hypothetical protein n=1 Tax=Mucilaginibacter rubeus TaxID=2027860 RepID=UPI0016693BFE|nr:hypothetical protein [Mucilaginibacter rubeus]GGA95957.1 hypothetical protein GCM10011500_09660 [Mucilaginibacter rubeus]